MTPLQRWSESGGPSDANLRAALIDARRGPSQAQLNVLAESVARRSRLREQTVGHVPSTSWLTRVSVGLASIVLLSSAAWWRSSQRHGPATPTSPEVRAVAPAAPTAEPSDKAPSATQLVPQVASQQAPTRAISRAAGRRHSPAERNESSDGGDEVQVLQAARRALLSRPERALDLAQQHAARFAHGLFVEERQAIAIEALFKLGRVAQAERAMTRFFSDYPQSTYRTRLLRLAEEGSTSP